MEPLLSASTSLIMSCSSDSEGFWPRERITVPNSLVVIWPTRSSLSVSCPCIMIRVDDRVIDRHKVLRCGFVERAIGVLSRHSPSRTIAVLVL